MREATSPSSSSRVVLTILVCHTVWQTYGVGRTRAIPSRRAPRITPRLDYVVFQPLDMERIRRSVATR